MIEAQFAYGEKLERNFAVSTGIFAESRIVEPGAGWRRGTLPKDNNPKYKNIFEISWVIYKMLDLY